MGSKASFKEKLKYNFDNTLNAGPIAIIAWLAIISFIIIAIAALIISIFGIKPEGGTEMNFIEAFWQGLMRTFDAGNMAGDEGLSFRIVALLITIAGIFILSALIGALSSGLDAKIEEMRKGRSKIIETNHILILGWSPKIFTVITELIEANSNQKNARIVILADKDKVEMDDIISDKIEDKKTTKIICRSGNPLDLDDLNIVNPHEAKSIIVLSPTEGNEDISVIKTVLAITNNPNRKSSKYYIVAEIKEEKNMEAAYLVGGSEASFVHASDLIARITAQTCRQSGLSIIYTELLDYGGDEIYFKSEPLLVGKTYKEATTNYEKSIIMGLMTQNGDVILNPKPETIIEKGYQLIAIAEDDDKIVVSKMKYEAINLQAIKEKQVTEGKQENNLLLGWNIKGSAIIRELDQYVKEGSKILVVQDLEEIDEILENTKSEIKNQTIEYQKRDITERKTYEEINVTNFDNIIIMGYSSLDIQEADAKTLISLLHLRNISDKTGKDLSIVSEMFDLKNRRLAEVTKADDFIISENLISLMISQLAENKNLKKVFDDLFKSEGAEIYLKPATDYIKAGEKVNFYTIIEATARRGESALGYKLNEFARNPDKKYGVFLNPLKSKEIVITDKDKIIVLAEN